jgi:hypothetical protein
MDSRFWNVAEHVALILPWVAWLARQAWKLGKVREQIVADHKKTSALWQLHGMGEWDGEERRKEEENA